MVSLKQLVELLVFYLADHMADQLADILADPLGEFPDVQFCKPAVVKEYPIFASTVKIFVLYRNSCSQVN
jgi:hypothetical protein